MSLPLLVLVVTLGIAAIVAAVHFTGGSRTRILGSANDARAAFFDDHPDEPVADAWLMRDGAAAVLALRDGRTGLVRVVGAKILTRIVRPGDIKWMELREDATMAIRLHEFGWSKDVLRFTGMADARAALEQLNGNDSGEVRRRAAI